jgi:hypothetical protein
MIRGPSGKGLSVGYFPEIQSFDTTNVTQIIGYDTYHVNAFLNWIAGTTPANSEIQNVLTGTPNLFEGNSQAVSVAQKTYGYVGGSLAFTPQLTTALDFVDIFIRKAVTALKAKGIFDDTLVVVASKHGQSPIDPTNYGKISQHLIPGYVGVPVDFIGTDDVAPIFLKDQCNLDAAVDNFNENRDNPQDR